MNLKLAEYLDQVLEVAKDAGDIIEQYYHAQSAQVWTKPDRTPVTDADMAAHNYICRALTEISKWHVISEESIHDSKFQVAESTYWLVDPLDGTKEFIERTDEFTVNIALIHWGQPILGVIYAPVFKTAYYAYRQGGAFKAAEGEVPQPLHTRPFNQREFLYVISRRHSRDDLTSFKRNWPGCQVEEVGSSLKFCWIAEGRADLYIRRGPTSEWDTAAAQCILVEAGGKVVSLQGQPLIYNKGQLKNPEFLACGDRQCDINWF